MTPTRSNGENINCALSPKSLVLSPSTWRLLNTGALDGRMNMAIDEAMLEAYRRGQIPATIRFYRWTVPTVSLGYAQEWTDADTKRCHLLGVAVVRRPSGGRAVLHEGEITYSVVGSDRDGLGASIRATYCLTTGALQRGLQQLGVQAQIGRSRGEGWDGAACFQVGTAADLMWRGRKLAGSAQCRRGHAFLQHGSLLIDQDLERLAILLNTPLAMSEAAVTLQTILGRRVDWDEVKQALCVGFAKTFGVELVPGTLTDGERELATWLVYGPRGHQPVPIS